MSALVTAGALVATTTVAFQARKQARASLKLAQTAERQLEASAPPVLRPVRVAGGWFILDASTTDAGEFTIPLANRGLGVAEVEYAKVRLRGTSLGPGSFEDSLPGRGPRIAPGNTWTLRFRYSPEDVRGLKEARQNEIKLILHYMSASNGRRYRLVASIHYLKDRGWQLLEEETGSID
jgi:hypothetical protein